MYPEPLDALPLAGRPDLEQYRKRAKDLVKACTQEPDAIAQWAVDWLQALAGPTGDAEVAFRDERLARRAAEVAEFARRRLSGAGGRAACRLSDAQFVIARVHGFRGWRVLATHIESLARRESAVSVFEAAADAVVSGMRSH